MKKVVVFILLDAFRWDYINEKDTPFSGFCRRYQQSCWQNRCAMQYWITWL